ncbi:MAG TPA: hypothetical protein VIJ78_08800 [Pseudolabrys sp.]
MLKTITTVMVAAAIAATVTVLSAPATQVNATPVASAAPMTACTQRAWPYLGCVGTPYGSPHIRLVSTDRLPR